eukprot:Phypoly_transcript_05312.p1 GENE.Phypoly_transcript_05312~~Phypoly_transcript_05312.p1  ORF type:complete len:408 (+),score=71.68 Phypoly_transcript_05312:154-1377(+)
MRSNEGREGEMENISNDHNKEVAAPKYSSEEVDELQYIRGELRKTQEELHKAKIELSLLEKLKKEGDMSMQKEMQEMKGELQFLKQRLMADQVLLAESEIRADHLQQWKDATLKGSVPGTVQPNMNSKVSTKDWVVVRNQQAPVSHGVELDAERFKEICTLFPDANKAQIKTLALVSAFRQATGQSASLKERNFSGATTEAETALVVLHELMASIGVELSVLASEGGFKSVDQTMANGVADFGAIHMLLDEDVHAQFSVKVLQTYDDVTQTPEKIAAFVDQFEKDIAAALGLSQDHITVQELGRGSVVVQFLISAKDNKRVKVEQWANDLATMLATPSSKLYSGRIARDILPGQYKYSNQALNTCFIFVKIFHSLISTASDLYLFSTDFRSTQTTLFHAGIWITKTK